MKCSSFWFLTWFLTFKTCHSNNLIFAKFYHQEVDFNYNGRAKIKRQWGLLHFQLSRKRRNKISPVSQNCLNTVLEHNRVKNEMTTGDSSTSLFHDFFRYSFYVKTVSVIFQSRAQWRIWWLPKSLHFPFSWFSKYN